MNSVVRQDKYAPIRGLSVFVDRHRTSQLAKAMTKDTSPATALLLAEELFDRAARSKSLRKPHPREWESTKRI